MLFADFSALLLLAGTVAATPRHHWNGTAPVIPQGTAPVSASGTVSPIESGGDEESGKDAKAGKVNTPQETPGLLSPPAPAEALSSVPAAPAPAASSASQPALSTPASSSSGTSGGVSYSATFTEYGSGDGNSSPNCNAGTVSCGWYTYPGYFAAVSQNLFGAASGHGSACGSCWQLDPVSNPNAADTTAAVGGMKSIVVRVNNLCPSDTNEKDCGQTTLEDTNFAGANVNFDLCIDDGAANALFGTSGIQMAFGKATEVDCDGLWTGGSTNYTSPSDTSPSMPNASP